MAIGFLPPSNRRRAIFSVRGSHKIGYEEIDSSGHTWFLDINGMRLCRVIRFHEGQESFPEASPTGSSFVPADREP